MMVSNGNVTGLAARLEAEGLVERRASPADRRAGTLRLTPRGRREFARQSAAHEDWIAELLAGLAPADQAALHRLLGRAKDGARAAIAGGTGMTAIDAPLAGYAARHLRLEVAGGVATLTLDRPERKNPLTFESYAEAGRDLPRRRAGRRGAGLRRHRRRRQFLLRRRRARDHRPAAGARHQGADGLHRHDRRAGQGHARLPAADRRRGGRRRGRRRRHPRHGLRPAARHAAREGGLPVQPRRPRRLRHGRLRHPAAHRRPGAGERAALHRPRAAARRRGSPGASSTGWSRPEALAAEAAALAREHRRGARPSPTP